MSKRYCNGVTSFGHGDAMRCGMSGFEGLYQCHNCQIKDLTEQRDNLVEALLAVLSIYPLPNNAATDAALDAISNVLDYVGVSADPTESEGGEL